MTLYSDDGSFAYARQPWIPKLVDILYRGSKNVMTVKASELPARSASGYTPVPAVPEAYHIYGTSSYRVYIPADTEYLVLSTYGLNSIVLYERDGSYRQFTPLRDTFARFGGSEIYFTVEDTAYSREGFYFSRFGLQACVWDTTLTYLAGAKDAIVQYFNERYLYRMISQETLERWQVRLQTKLDEIAPRYDRAIRLYAQNNALMDKVMASQTTTYNNVKDEKGGQDTVTATDSDTVDTAINASHQYADSVRTTVDSGNRSNTRSGSVTVEAEPEGGILENVNLNTDDWRNLTVQFAAEFENLFLNVLC